MLVTAWAALGLVTVPSRGPQYTNRRTSTPTPLCPLPLNLTLAGILRPLLLSSITPRLRKNMPSGARNVTNISSVSSERRSEPSVVVNPPIRIVAVRADLDVGMLALPSYGIWVITQCPRSLQPHLARRACQPPTLSYQSDFVPTIIPLLNCCRHIPPALLAKRSNNMQK